MLAQHFPPVSFWLHEADDALIADALELLEDQNPDPDHAADFDLEG